MSQSDKIVNEIRELHKAGKSTNFIIAIVADSHNISENEVRGILKELALTSSSSQNLEALVKTMRENLNKNLKREDLVKLMSDSSGYSISTSNHMLSQLNFAKEYARQVNESK